jgi:biopolymer transport protein ExbB/TolQ
MENWVAVVSLIFNLLLSGGVVTTFLLYRKQSVRIKNAEAFASEVEVLRSEVKALQESVEFERKQREEDKKIIVTLETLNTSLFHAKSGLEVKYALRKKATNRAYECTFCPDSSKCPVLMQVKYNDDNELKSLVKNKG